MYRYIILPQAYRIVLPPLTSEFMGTIKYSSVALTIGLLELTGQARSMQEFSFHIFEAFRRDRGLPDSERRGGAGHAHARAPRGHPRADRPGGQESLGARRG